MLFLPLRAVVGLLVVGAFAACVRNPFPVAPVSPDGPESVVVPADVPAAAAPRWATFHAADRSVGGVESSGAPLPREWRGLFVAAPRRCSSFEPVDYAAPAGLVPRLRAQGRAFRDPLSCSLFGDVGGLPPRAGRIVSAAVAHDAGLCARPEARAAFAADPDNRLYLSAVVAAARHRAVERGDGDWLPSRNLCWYVGTQLRVRRRHGLSVSSWEARLFDAVLRGCPAVAPGPRCDVLGRGVW